MASDECRLWWVDPSAAPPWCEDLLSDAERTRARSFHRVEDRRRFTVATALLKVTVAQAVDRDPREVTIRRECPHCGGPHGKPRVVGHALDVSISHSGDLVVVALHDGGPVGVDVEQLRPDVDVDGMLRLMLAAPERAAFRAISDPRERREAFYRCWTRKESVLKATGDGLRVSMALVTLDPPVGPVRSVDLAGGPRLPGPARVTDLTPAPGYVGALTVLSAAPVRVRERDGAAALASAAPVMSRAAGRRRDR